MRLILNIGCLFLDNTFLRTLLELNIDLIQAAKGFPTLCQLNISVLSNLLFLSFEEQRVISLKKLRVAKVNAAVYRKTFRFWFVDHKWHIRTEPAVAGSLITCFVPKKLWFEVSLELQLMRSCRLKCYLDLTLFIRSHISTIDFNALR